MLIVGVKSMVCVITCYGCRGGLDIFMQLLCCALKDGEMDNMTSPHGQIIVFLG